MRKIVNTWQQIPENNLPIERNNKWPVGSTVMFNKVAVTHMSVKHLSASMVTRLSFSMVFLDLF